MVLTRSTDKSEKWSGYSHPMITSHYYRCSIDDFCFAQWSQINSEIDLNFYLIIFYNLRLNLVRHRTGHFYLNVFVRSDFVSWFFFKNFQTFLEVKIEINRVILTPCPANWVLQKLPLCTSKVEHFSCFVIPCQTRLSCLVM